MMNTAVVMGDKEVMGDVLATQKFVTSNYNMHAGECQCTQLRDEFLNLLREEHMIQYDIFTEMNARGWYEVKNAPQGEIGCVIQKLQAG